MPFHFRMCILMVFVFVAGNISTLAALDRESKSRYWLSVYAQDHGVAPLHSRVEVSVKLSHAFCPSPLRSLLCLLAMSANTLFCQLLQSRSLQDARTSCGNFAALILVCELHYKENNIV